MQVLAENVVGFGGAEASIKFLPGNAPYQAATNDLFWKIALAVPNIEMACLQLRGFGVSVGAPHQFHDVGYLAHFRDPGGFPIELVQHTFQGEPSVEPTDKTRLGGGAHLNLLTLRAADIAPIRRACADWGMTLLSIQPVESHGFTLYFFAFTSEQPPSQDLFSLENRTWVYQRPYTVLEVQHLHDVGDLRDISEAESGYVGTDISNFSAHFKKAILLKFLPV